MLNSAIIYDLRYFHLNSHSGTSSITCSHKAGNGLLYPLERGFIFVHKPPVHVRFDEISCVNFARGSTTGRTFDFDVELKNGTTISFSNIERLVDPLESFEPMALNH